MNVLDKTGIELAFKKGWFKVEGTYFIGNTLYLGLEHEDLPAKAKKPLIVTLPQQINLGDRFVALVDYHPDLRTKGTLNGPTVLSGNEQYPIAFRFMADEDMNLAELPYIVSLVLCKISL